jgi:hypothetical protein
MKEKIKILITILKFLSGVGFAILFLLCVYGFLYSGVNLRLITKESSAENVYNVLLSFSPIFVFLSLFLKSDWIKGFSFLVLLYPTIKLFDNYCGSAYVLFPISLFILWYFLFFIEMIL